MKPPAAIPRFSQELFWDTRMEEIDFARNKRWVIVRVLEHGRKSNAGWKRRSRHASP